MEAGWRHMWAKMQRNSTFWHCKARHFNVNPGEVLHAACNGVFDGFVIFLIKLPMLQDHSICSGGKVVWHNCDARSSRPAPFKQIHSACPPGYFKVYDLKVSFGNSLAFNSQPGGMQQTCQEPHAQFAWHL